MSTITGKELVKNAFGCKKCERIPWVPFVGVHAGELIGADAESYLKSEELIVNGVERAIKLYRADGIPVLFDLQLEAEALGCELMWAKDNPPSVKSHPIESGVALEQLPKFDPSQGRIATVMSAASALTRGNPDVAFYGLVTGPFTLALHLKGTGIFMEMYTNPQEIHKILRFCCDIARQMVLQYKRAGVEIIAVVDPMTSQIGPDLFVDFISEYAFELFRFISSEHLLSSFFVCGDASHNIEVMCDCRPDNISIDENIELESVKKICLSKGISFGGNLKLTSTLLLGDEVDCELDALECIDKGGDVGFILAPGCDLPYHTKSANLEAVSRLPADGYRQDVLRAMGSVSKNIEPIDPKMYSDDSFIKVDIITLDSGSCAPCRYMVGAVEKACEGLDKWVRIEEHKIKSREGLEKMQMFGVTKIPSICIDGVPLYQSSIPPVGDLRRDIIERMKEKGVK